MAFKHTTQKDSTLKFSRRGFAKGLTTALIAAPFAVRAQEGPFRARVKIDTERVIGDIDPKIYGNFIERLGRCIDGGVFEEGSPLSDPNGFRRDALEAARGLNVVNRHRDQSIEVEFEAQDKQFAGPVEVAEVNGPDIKAENDFGATKAQTVTRSANADGRKLRYRLSPHSYTMLKVKLV